MGTAWSPHNTERDPRRAATPLLIRHDITRRASQPNNPSISPQLAKLNVLANSKGHDLQIVGNIWSSLQRTGLQLFLKIKYKWFHAWSSLYHFVNSLSYQEWGPSYIQTETCSCVFILWSETTQQRLFTALTVLLMPRGGREHQDSGHRVRQQVLHHLANNTWLCLHITRVASTLCGFLTMPPSTTSFGIILMERIFFFKMLYKLARYTQL